MRREYFSFQFFSGEICRVLQSKNPRIMRDARARNANKDGIFSEFVCLLNIRD
jgi:hypothetical protein